MEQIEGNKLIAEFMGWTFIPKDEYVDFDRLERGYEAMSADAMKYHTSWDWLMPVVEKIEGIYNPDTGVGITLFTIYWNFEKRSHTCTINFRKKFNGILSKHKMIQKNNKSKIESTHSSVLQFIQWYNQQKQPT